MQLSKKLKVCYHFYSHFCNLHQIFNISNKKIQGHSSTISDIIDSERFLLLSCLKNYVLGHPLALNVLTGPKHWWNLQQEFFSIVSFLEVGLRWKTSLLLTSEILGLFVKTLTGDDNYSCYKSQKFGQTFQEQLSKKQKICYQLFIAFLQSTSIFQLFEKKDQAHSPTMSVLLTPKDLVTYMS